MRKVSLRAAIELEIMLAWTGTATTDAARQAMMAMLLSILGTFTRLEG